MGVLSKPNGKRVKRLIEVLPRQIFERSCATISGENSKGSRSAPGNRHRETESSWQKIGERDKEMNGGIWGFSDIPTLIMRGHVKKKKGEKKR